MCTGDDWNIAADSRPARRPVSSPAIGVFQKALRAAAHALAQLNPAISSGYKTRPDMGPDEVRTASTESECKHMSELWSTSHFIQAPAVHY